MRLLLCYQGVNETVSLCYHGVNETVVVLPGRECDGCCITRV
jgi:hypothetical protein